MATIERDARHEAILNEFHTSGMTPNASCEEHRLSVSSLPCCRGRERKQTAALGVSLRWDRCCVAESGDAARGVPRRSCCRIRVASERGRTGCNHQSDYGMMIGPDLSREEIFSRPGVTDMRRQINGPFVFLVRRSSRTPKSAG